MCSSLTEGEEGFSLPHNLKDSVVYVGSWRQGSPGGREGQGNDPLGFSPSSVFISPGHGPWDAAIYTQSRSFCIN